MSRSLPRCSALPLLAILALTAACTSGPGGQHARAARAEATRAGGILADHRAADAFDRIPPEAIAAAKKKFAIYYSRTSHGSQVEVGMHMLANRLGDTYSVPRSFLEGVNGDLGEHGNLEFEKLTRKALSGFGGMYNVVMWSWCGGATENDSTGIQAYLDAMERLEAAYPTVLFVYMTGHTNQWQSEVTRRNNQQIRDYCKAHNKVLYDFEDIESWDPDGNFYADAGDDCKWCESWCSSHECPGCTECSHSHCFNCYRKGQAFWWMMARLAGWPGEDAAATPPPADPPTPAADPTAAED